MDVLKLLEDVKNDKVSLEEAAKELKQLPYEDLGFAKLDHHRQIRSGFGEVVFCSGKSDEHLLKIYETFYKTDTEVLGTRASEHQYELVKAVIPEVTYDPLSRILKIEKPGKERIGRVAVCTAGTADIAVAEEAAQVAEYFGTNVDRFYDVMVGHETKVGDDAKEKTKTVTENLTGVVKEEPKTITEFFDEIKSNICDNYCKYPSEIKDYDELIETVCSKCPLRKLN